MSSLKKNNFDKYVKRRVSNVRNKVCINKKINFSNKTLIYSPDSLKLSIESNSKYLLNKIVFNKNQHLHLFYAYLNINTDFDKL